MTEDDLPPPPPPPPSHDVDEPTIVMPRWRWRALRTALIFAGIYLLGLGWFTYQGFQHDEDQDRDRCRVTLLGREGSENKDRVIFGRLAERFGVDEEDRDFIMRTIEDAYADLPEPADC